MVTTYKKHDELIKVLQINPIEYWNLMKKHNNVSKVLSCICNNLSYKVLSYIFDNNLHEELLKINFLKSFFINNEQIIYVKNEFKNGNICEDEMFLQNIENTINEMLIENEIGNIKYINKVVFQYKSESIDEYNMQLITWGKYIKYSYTLKQVNQHTFVLKIFEKDDFDKILSRKDISKKEMFEYYK